MSRLATFARTTETDIDDLVAHVGAQTKLKLLVMPALFAGSFALVLPEQLTVWFRVVAWTALLAQTAI